MSHLGVTVSVTACEPMLISDGSRLILAVFELVGVSEPLPIDDEENCDEENCDEENCLVTLPLSATAKFQLLTSKTSDTVAVYVPSEASVRVGMLPLTNAKFVS